MSRIKQKTGEVVLHKTVPHMSAKKFRDLHRPNLLCLEGEWNDYDPKTGAYKRISKKTIRADVQAFLVAARLKGKPVKDEETGELVEEDSPFNPKASDTNEVYEALDLLCHRAILAFKPPCWLDGGEGKPAPADIIVCQNGLLDIKTRKLLAHTPNFFTYTALPINYDKDAKPPEDWSKFMADVTENRQPIVKLIQEWLGYLLSGDNELEAVMYFLGKSRGGKGTTMKVMHALIGENNLASPSIRNFASDYWAWPLMSKSAAIITDMTLSDKQAVKLAASHINMVSGRDPVDIPRKFLESITGYTLPTRLTMAGNALPDFGDHAEALSNRLLVAPFDVSFKGREDRGLARRMIANELPGILNWALDGLDALRQRGHFDEPDESKIIKEQLIRLSNPVRVFVEDRCVVRPGLAVPRATLYQAYEAWCKSVGMRPLADKDFGQRLRDIVPQGGRRFRPCEDGKQVEHYLDIALAADSTVAEFSFRDRMQGLIDLGVPAAEAFAETCAEADKRTVGDIG